jgi:hypothetical protein
MLIVKCGIDRQVCHYQNVSTSLSYIVHTFGFGLFGQLTAWANPDRLGRNCNVDPTMVKSDRVETR